MKSQKDMTQLGELVRKTRESAGLSARKLEELSGLDHSFISKLEKSTYRNLSPDTLTTLSDSLGLPAADLFALAGYPVPDSLPSFGPYLRARYGEELPEGAQAALTELFDTLSQHYVGSDEVDDESPAPNQPGRQS